MKRATALAILFIAIALYGMVRSFSGTHELAFSIAFGFISLAIFMLIFLVGILLGVFAYFKAQEWYEDAHWLRSKRGDT